MSTTDGDGEAGISPESAALKQNRSHRNDQRQQGDRDSKER
ncbi:MULTISPECIES: hypothetical protein [unclassified Synechococcus]|nr:MULTISPECIES: hypothetical protein [unclassified Synechococcus]WFN58312.1 hypothetical protein N4320_10885 [Synechococcus sp. CCFWC 502]